MKHLIIKATQEPGKPVELQQDIKGFNSLELLGLATLISDSISENVRNLSIEKEGSTWPTILSQN